MSYKPQATSDEFWLKATKQSWLTFASADETENLQGFTADNLKWLLVLSVFLPVAHTSKLKARSYKLTPHIFPNQA